MTIHDVAKAAGVSVATVSKVVNARYGVAPSTAEHVMEVVTALGYETSLIASSLRRQHTNVIGILVAEFEPFSTEILKGIAAATRGTPYQLLAYSGSPAQVLTGWERRSLSRLGGTLIDGAVIVTPTEVITDASIPIVAVDPHAGPTGPSTVDSDNIGGARAAAQHLIELGHTRIAHVRGRTDLISATLREQGFREALAHAGIALHPDDIRDGGYQADETTAAAHALLSRPDRPTAIFAANDLSAIRIIEIAHERGIRVPQDLSVIGFDDIPEAAKCDPPLTTISQPLQQMGAEAVQLLLKSLAGDTEVTHLHLPATLVARGSTGQAPR